MRLLLNIGSAGDLAGAAADFEGVGLVRSEFLYLRRAVVLRTLDAGADKPLPFLGLPPEENPAALQAHRLLEVVDFSRSVPTTSASTRWPPTG